jgi:phosphonate transport system substrate-binding protein
VNRFKAIIAMGAAVGLAAALGAGGCGSHGKPAKPWGKSVRISIQPVYTLPMMNQKYRDLAARLEEKTGYRIEMVSSLSYTNYLSTLEGARVDAGFMNPLTYVITRKTRGAYPLAKAVDGRSLEDRYRGIILVRGDSGIETCEELRGRTIAIASRRACGGYLTARAKCVEMGMDPERDAFMIMAPTQDEALRQVYEKRAAAAFVREDILASMRERVDVYALRVLAYTDYIPTWCFAAFRDTDPEVARKLREALLGLDRTDAEDAEALAKAGLAGFVPAEDSDYDVVRRMADRVQVPH